MKYWQLIIEIIHKLIKWIDWYLSDERKARIIEDKMKDEGWDENDPGKIHWALMRRKRRKK